MIEPPHTESYFWLWSKKWDTEAQRNILLQFINEHELDSELLAYLQKYELTQDRSDERA